MSQLFHCAPRINSPRHLAVRSLPLARRTPHHAIAAAAAGRQACHRLGMIGPIPMIWAPPLCSRQSGRPAPPLPPGKARPLCSRLSASPARTLARCRATSIPGLSARRGAASSRSPACPGLPAPSALGRLSCSPVAARPAPAFAFSLSRSQRGQGWRPGSPTERKPGGKGKRRRAGLPARPPALSTVAKSAPAEADHAMLAHMSQLCENSPMLVMHVISSVLDSGDSSLDSAHVPSVLYDMVVVRSYGTTVPFGYH